MDRLTDIQQISWPKVGICTEEKLYFRRGFQGCHYVCGQEKLCFEKSGTVDFDTYFNCFSTAKWKKYTHVSSVYLRLRLCGAFQVLLLGYQYRNGSVIRSVLKAEVFHSEQDAEVTVGFPAIESLAYSFSLQALSKKSTFLGGSYCCPDEKHRRPIDLALNICTYHREEFIRKTLLNLEKNVFSNPRSELYGHVHVYITDNGQTLVPEEVQCETVHLNSQNGFGSSGGFARGQLAIQKDQAAYALTHMIFMDDDILFDIDALRRTVHFLSLLKQEYWDYILGSSLLRLHAQAWQVEAGACWVDGRITSIKPGLNLTALDQVLFNELEEVPNYQGWWFCCVPLSSAPALPMPVYFHRDDVEFGLRQKGFVYLNGICVWHDEFENKPSSTNEYYDKRNQLIVNAIHCPAYGCRVAMRDLFRDVLRKTIAYRYREADLILEGVQDFCRGIDWMLTYDGQEHHNELIEKGYHPESPTTLDFTKFEDNLCPSAPRSSFRKRLRSIAGVLLPANKTAMVPMHMPSISCFYRVKSAVNYNSATQTAYVTKKSFIESFFVLIRLFKTGLQMGLRFHTAVSQWRTRATELSSEKFWRAKLMSSGDDTKDFI